MRGPGHSPNPLSHMTHHYDFLARWRPIIITSLFQDFVIPKSGYSPFHLLNSLTPPFPFAYPFTPLLTHSPSPTYSFTCSLVSFAYSLTLLTPFTYSLHLLTPISSIILPSEQFTLF